MPTRARCLWERESERERVRETVDVPRNDGKKVFK
jgi:hypothetical protein